MKFTTVFLRWSVSQILYSEALIVVDDDDGDDDDNDDDDDDGSAAIWGVSFFGVQK